MDDCADACVRGTWYEGEIESPVAIYETYEPDAAGTLPHSVDSTHA